MAFLAAAAAPAVASSISPVIGSALIGGATGLLSGIGNFITGQKNYEHQKALLDYQKQMQQESWNREDNAVQRRVADLKAAGLSPVLAAGSAAGSSSPIQLNAPKDESNPGQIGAAAIEKALAMSQLAKTNMDAMAVQAQMKKTQLESSILSLDEKYYRLTGKYPRGNDDALTAMIKFINSQAGEKVVKKGGELARQAEEKIPVKLPGQSETTEIKNGVPHRGYRY